MALHSCGVGDPHQSLNCTIQTFVFVDIVIVVIIIVIATTTTSIGTCALTVSITAMPLRLVANAVSVYTCREI